MPFDFVKYDSKCAQLGPDELQKEWEHYTRQIAGASTSTAVSGLAIPLTAGVSVIGVGLAAPTIHNARKKREIIERHLQRHGTTHQTRKRDVAGSMAFSGTLGVLTLGVGAVGHEAVMSAGVEHGVSNMMNETAIKIGIHAALDGAAVATEEAHHAHKKEKAAGKLQRLKQQAQSFTSEKPSQTPQVQPNATYAAVAIPGVYSIQPYNPQMVAAPVLSVTPAPVSMYQQPQTFMTPPSPMLQPILQPFSPPPIVAPIPQHITQPPVVTAFGVSPCPTPAPPPYTSTPQTPYNEKAQPLGIPQIGTPLPAYTPQPYMQPNNQAYVQSPQAVNQLHPQPSNGFANSQPGASIELPNQPISTQPHHNGTMPSPAPVVAYHQQPGTQNLPPFTAYVAAPGFNPPVPVMSNMNTREQQPMQNYQPATSSASPPIQSIVPQYQPEFHQQMAATASYAPPTPQQSHQAQWQHPQAPIPQDPAQQQQQNQPGSYFPPPPNSNGQEIPQSYTPAPPQQAPSPPVPVQHATYQPSQPTTRPSYAYPTQYQPTQSPLPQQAMPQYQPQQSYPPTQSPPPQQPVSPYQPQHQYAPTQPNTYQPQQMGLMTPPLENQNQIPAYDPTQWQNPLPSPMPTPGYEKMNPAWNQSQPQTPAPAYPGGMSTAGYPNEKISTTEPMIGLSNVYGNMRVS